MIIEEYLEGHLAEGVGSAAEAGVVGADSDFHFIEHTIGDDRLSVEFGDGDFADGFVHGFVVVGGGDDEVTFGDFTFFVGFVVVDECAAWCFDDADALCLSGAFALEVGAQDFRIEEQVFHNFGAVQHFDESGPVVVHAVVVGPGACLAEQLEFELSEGCRDAVGDIESGERPHAVPAVLSAEVFEVWKLEVGPGFYGFREIVAVLSFVNIGERDESLGIDGAHAAVIEFELTGGRNEAEVSGGEAGEGIDFMLVCIVVMLDKADCFERPLDHGVDIGDIVAQEEVIAFLGVEGFVGAAGCGADAVDAFAGDGFDNFLAELAHEDTFLGEGFIRFDDGHDVALGGWGIGAEEEIGGGEVEEVQGVRLENLTIVK